MDNKRKIGGFSLFALWFGAAISLAEILTGSGMSSLGIKKGIFVILLGHLIGCFILAFVGVIGFREKKPALISSRISLGIYGSYIISVFNIVQLIGWTAIMLIQCTKSIQSITGELFGINNFALLVVIVGILVGVWALNADKGINLINNVAVILLIILSVVMLGLVIKGEHVKQIAETMSFGLALELSIAMPLSWVPLISDYTSRSKSAKGSFLGSFLGYFIGSSFMFIIGLITAVYTGASDPIGILSKLNMGIAALLIVILATVTTTFMDVYSTVLSTLNLTKKFSKKQLIIVFTALGTILALVFPMEQYTNFLILIASIFAPAFSVVIIDYFFYKRDRSGDKINLLGVMAALIGSVSYYIISKYDLVIGASIPSIAITVLVYIVMRFINKKMVRGDENDVK